MSLKTSLDNQPQCTDRVPPTLSSRFFGGTDLFSAPTLFPSSHWQTNSAGFQFVGKLLQHLHTQLFLQFPFNFSFLQCSSSSLSLCCTFLLHYAEVLKTPLNTISLLVPLRSTFCLLVWSYPTIAFLLLSFGHSPSTFQDAPPPLPLLLYGSCELLHTSQRTSRGQRPLGTHLRRIVMRATLANRLRDFLERRKDKNSNDRKNTNP